MIKAILHFEFHMELPAPPLVELVCLSLNNLASAEHDTSRAADRLWRSVTWLQRICVDHKVFSEHVQSVQSRAVRAGRAAGVAAYPASRVLH